MFPWLLLTGALLQVWVTFQQKWIFLNKVLHEMKIQFPSSDLVGKGGVAGWASATGQWGSGWEGDAALTLTFSLTTALPFRGHG